MIISDVVTKKIRKSGKTVQDHWTILPTGDKKGTGTTLFRCNLHFIHFYGRQKRISALRMTIFCVSVPLFADSVKNKVKMSFSHVIQNLLETALPTESLLCNHKIGFWPVLLNFFWVVKPFAFWSSMISDVQGVNALSNFKPYSGKITHQRKFST